MKVKVCFGILFALLLNSFVAGAQNAIASQENLYEITTPYEKARLKLVEQAETKLSKITSAEESFATLLLGAILSQGDYSNTPIGKLESRENMIAMFIGVSQFSQLDQSQEEYYYNQMLKQLGADVYGPKNQFAQWYIKERERIAKTKTAADTQREKLRTPPSGSILKMKRLVTSNFCSWATKGEFESTNEYRHRTETQAVDIFDSICQSIVVTISLENITLTAGEYDADNETLLLTLSHGENDKLNIKDSMSATLAKDWVPDMREGFYAPDKKDSVMSVGVSNGYIYPTRTYFVTKGRYRHFYININLPKVVLAYNDLSIGDTLLNFYLKGHIYQGQTADELKRMREDNDPHFQKWGNYFKTREDYRNQVANYGKGEEFELKTQFQKFESKIRYEYFARTYKQGGLEEVTKYIALRDSCYKYTNDAEHKLWYLYENGGLNNLEQHLEKVKVEHLERLAETERVQKEQERLAQERAAEAERILKKTERQGKLIKVFAGIGVVVAGVIYYFILPKCASN